MAEDGHGCIVDGPPLLPTPEVYFRPCEAADVARCAELEAAGYPADEAASPERLAYRQAHAGDFFLVAVQATTQRVVGFVCGTLSRADCLTHESMGTHEPDGRTLCVHSVCVDGALRRRGVALSLLRAYVRYLDAAAAPHVRSVRLIAKPYLSGLYEKAGFKLEGPSPVVHGVETWNEFGLLLQRDAQHAA